MTERLRDHVVQRRYLRLMEALFIESNPIPVKAAMAMMGLLEPVWRLPLCAPQPAEPRRNSGRCSAELGLVNA